MSTKISSLLISQVIFGTLRNVVNEFIVDRKTRGLSPRTVQYYNDELRYFSDYMDLIGVEKFNEITTGLIRQYLLNLGNSRNKGGVHASYRAIRALFRWYELEYEPDDWKNPITRVQISNPPIAPLPGISIDNVRLLLDNCHGLTEKRDKAFMLFLIDTGIRASELISLSIRDVNFISGSVAIHHGKGGKSRTVFLAKGSRKALIQYLKTRADLQEDQPLFPNYKGDRYTLSGLRAIIRRISKIAGIPEPGLHDFRRAFALAMVRNGSDLLTVSRLLGHSSLVVTQRYLAINDTDLHEVHRKTSPADNLYND